MGKKAPSAPAAPDPVATANAQAAANKETAIANAMMNRMNQYTPYGNTIYNRLADVNGTPTWEMRQTLSPQQQALFDSQNRIDQSLYGFGENQLNRINQSFGQNFDMSRYARPEISDFAADRDKVVADTFNNQLARLNPVFERDTKSLNQSLANRGIAEGSELYTRELAANQQRRDDSLRDLSLAAFDKGINEQGRLYNMAMGDRQNKINEDLFKRQLPLNELNQLLSGANPAQLPQQLQQYNTGMNAPDVQGAIQNKYNADMMSYQARMNSRNANMGAMGSLFGAGLSAASNPASLFGYSLWG